VDSPDAVHAVIGGRPDASLRCPLSRVGALLDAAALQPSRSARNHLLWLPHSKGLGARRVDGVIAQAGLARQCEVADAFLGVHGLNKRKGVRRSRGDLLDELADVIITAAVA